MWRACLSIWRPVLDAGVVEGERWRRGKEGGVAKGYLCDAGAEEGSDEELEAFQLRLDDDEGEVGFRVHVACLRLEELDLGYLESGLSFEGVV